MIVCSTCNGTGCMFAMNGRNTVYPRCLYFDLFIVQYPCVSASYKRRITGELTYKIVSDKTK